MISKKDLDSGKQEIYGYAPRELKYCARLYKDRGEYIVAEYDEIQCIHLTQSKTLTQARKVFKETVERLEVLNKQ